MNEHRNPSMKCYRSDALRSAHTAAEDLHAIGAIDDASMRAFDARCLVAPASTSRPLAAGVC